MSDKAIRAQLIDVLSLGSVTTTIAKIAFTYLGEDIKTIKAYDVKSNLLFTLTFNYSAGKLVDITRS